MCAGAQDKPCGQGRPVHVGVRFPVYVLVAVIGCVALLSLSCIATPEVPTRVQVDTYTCPVDDGTNLLFRLEDNDRLTAASKVLEDGTPLVQYNLPKDRTVVMKLVGTYFTMVTEDEAYNSFSADKDMLRNLGALGLCDMERERPSASRTITRCWETSTRAPAQVTRGGCCTWQSAFPGRESMTMPRRLAARRNRSLSCQTLSRPSFP